MDTTSCRCGAPVTFRHHHLACLECGAGCCPACAIQLESASYCRSCAGSLLGMVTVRSAAAFDFH